MTAPETPLPSPPGMNITDKNKLKGSLFIEAYGSLIDGISKDAESETEKALDITFNAIGAASATVMLAIDPLGSLIGAGIGWLIEHVSFLRDALNQLMGNPEEIQANVEANKAKAVELRQLAEDHKSGLAKFDGWTGVSSERFQASMDGMSQELDDLANAVESKAKIVAIMGMLVTVLRDIVRDMIAQLLGSLIGGALLAAAAMIPTFGASIPIFIGFATGKAVALGVNIASRVARVVAALGRQMKRIGDLDDIMAKVSKGWNRFENGADVAEIAYEGYKAQNEVDKAVDKVTPGGGGGGGTATASTPNAVANARVGTVETEGVAASRMTAVQAPHARIDGTEPLQPLQTARRMDATEPLQPFQTARAMDATEPAQPFQTARRMDAVEPLQPMHAASRIEAEPVQLARMSAVEAPMAQARLDATPMHEVVARTASDSTMVSGVAMTSSTPVHQAIQPHEMYNTVEAAPAEALQQASPFEPVARTQMSHTFEALEPAREDYNPLTAYSSVEATPAEPMHSAAAYDTVAQSGGAPVQPLRPTVVHERPTRPSE